MSNPEYTDDQLVQRYIELRNFLKDEAERQEQYTKPYVANMQAIQNELHTRLLERGGRAGSTDHGTFFFKTTTSAKVADRAAFFNFVFEHRAESYLTSHVSKDAVTEHIEKTGSPPPGVNVEQLQVVQVRAS